MSSRPDIGRSALFAVLALVVAGAAFALVVGRGVLPGTPLRQGVAIVGSVLLLVPALFAFVKRTGLAASPPAWFVAHVLAGAAGCVLVFAHAAGGSLFSPPGLLLLAAAFVVVQGLLARALLAQDLATRFAATPTAFRQPDPRQREALGRVIAAKQSLLARIDAAATEALFSLQPRHWLRHPLLSARYHRLVMEESRWVGARARAGVVLSGWRRLHMLAGWLLLLGLLVHVVVVTFFAGYVAEGETIYWWHLSDWGGP